jgi:hypothetical protein
MSECLHVPANPPILKRVATSQISPGVSSNQMLTSNHQFTRDEIAPVDSMLPCLKHTSNNRIYLITLLKKLHSSNHQPKDKFGLPPKEYNMRPGKICEYY